MLTFRVAERTGPVVVAAVVTAAEELILVSSDGIVMRTRADTVSQQGRSTQGVQVMNVGDDDSVASLARIDLSAGSGTPGGSADDLEDEDEAPED